MKTLFAMCTLVTATLWGAVHAQTMVAPLATRDAAPALVIVQAQLSPATVASGAHAELRVEIMNRGTAASPPATALVSQSGRRVGGLRWPALGAGARQTQSLRLPIAAAPGRHCYDVQLNGTRERVSACATVMAAAPTAAQPLSGADAARTTRPVVPRAPIAMPSAPAAVPVAKAPKRVGALRAVVAGTLRLNGSTGVVPVATNASASVSWDLSGITGSPVPPSGVHLLVHDMPMPADNCAQAPPATSSPDSGFRSGAPTGSHAITISNTYYVAGRSYYIKGCVFGQDALGSLVYTGFETNTIEMRYGDSSPPQPDGLPDLTVSDILLHGDELRFVVRNLGPGVKRPTPRQIKFVLRVRDTGDPGKDFDREGIAAFTTLMRLLPNDPDNWAEERVIDTRIRVPKNKRFTVCINESRAGTRVLEEASYANNCRTEDSSAIWPDLEVVSGRFYPAIKEKKKNDPWYEVVWDFVSSPVDFDTSGVPWSHAQVRVRNNGTEPVSNYVVRLTGGQLGGEKWETKVSEPLAPGAERVVDVSGSKAFDKAGCCDIAAWVDPDNRITESNEWNNFRKLQTIIGVRVHRRDHR